MNVLLPGVSVAEYVSGIASTVKLTDDVSGVSKFVPLIVSISSYAVTFAVNPFIGRTLTVMVPPEASDVVVKSSIIAKFVPPSEATSPVSVPVPVLVSVNINSVCVP